MKISEPYNYQGQPLITFSWVSEDENCFYLKNAQFSSYALPKCDFENLKKNFGASRDGTTFLIPMPAARKL